MRKSSHCVHVAHAPQVCTHTYLHPPTHIRTYTCSNKNAPQILSQKLAVPALITYPSHLNICSSDHPKNFTVADIGYDWVYLNWSNFTLTFGLSKWEYNITCLNESALTTPDTFHNITNLLFNATYNCQVVAFWIENKASSLSTPPVSFTPGKFSL